MTEQTRSGGSGANSLCEVVTVPTRPAIAWRVFTESIGTWWPLAQLSANQALPIGLSVVVETAGAP